MEEEKVVAHTCRCMDTRTRARAQVQTAHSAWLMAAAWPWLVIRCIDSSSIDIDIAALHLLSI